MNTSFSLKRVWAYLKWGVIFNKKRHLYALLTIPGIYGLNVVFYYFSGNPMSNNLLPLVMTMFPIALEPMLNEKEIDNKFVYNLPASSFERFAAMWLKCVLLFPLFAFGLYFLINEFFTFLSLFPTSGSSYFSSLFQKASYGYPLYFWLGGQSIIIAATLSFSRKDQWKMGVMFLVLFFLTLSFGTSILKIGATGNSISGNNSGLVWPGWFISTMKYYLLFLFPFGMWVVSYFRIREKEI